MLQDFLNYIKENRLIKKGDRILAAVSGGIDSMVMADLLLQAGLLSGIAHCNFGLRDKESDLDEQMVSQYASKHYVPFYSVRFMTKDHARKNGISIEMAARELRYEWFKKIRKEGGYAAVAVAHNLNDNAETLLLNLIRGTGIAGLTGMKPSANHIIRPLLFATRKSIEEYRDKNGISFREDMTNADTKFIRNKIRHKVIPLLREINTSVELTLNDTAERLSGIYDILSDVISRTRNSIFMEEKGKIIVNINRLEPYLENKAFLFELFRPYGISGSLLKDLMKVITGRTGGQIFSGTHRILKNRNEILITAQPENEKETYIASSLADLRKCPSLVKVKTVTVSKNLIISSDPGAASLDLQKISFPVIIRKWKPGDYFFPFGMKQKKKLSDYFIDSKFSRLEKEKAIIMESGGKIVWIIGERIDNRFRITKSTKKALILKSNH
jgi:tRNA(Ile)-lysidine synthase